MKVVGILGEPGVGKTTLVTRLLAECGQPVRCDAGLLKMQLYPAGVLALGIYDGSTFAGSDRLSMGVMPHALEAASQLEQLFPDEVTVLFEGDRLMCAPFLNRLSNLDLELKLIKLEVTPKVAAARRAARGGKQNEGWVKGRITKVERLSASYPFEVWANDAEEQAEQNLSKLRAAVTVGLR